MERKKIKFTPRKVLKKAIDDERSILELTEELAEEFIVDGKAVIPVNVGDQLYDPLSMGHLLQLNSDIFGYIEESANLLPSQVPLRVIMHGVAEEDRARVVRLYKEHYELVVQDRLWDERKNRLRIIFSSVIGILFIMAYLFFAITKEGTLFLELLSVIGSFALWDAADCFTVDRYAIKKSLEEAAQYMLAEVDFSDEDDVLS